jgi:hypothetical protein
MAVAIIRETNFITISAPSYAYNLASPQDAQPGCYPKAFLFELSVAL